MYFVFWKDDDCFMLMIIDVCIYVAMSFFDKVVKDHSYGGMIAYVGEWHEEVPGLRGIKWKSSHEKYMRSISCGYELILCDYIMSMLWIAYTKGYINEMKEVWSVACWDKHG